MAASKNSRTVTTTAAAATAGAAKLIIPCNGGRNAYVYNPTSHLNPNVVTDSQAFIDAVAATVAGSNAARVRGELEELAQTYPGAGWDARLVTLEAAGALG